MNDEPLTENQKKIAADYYPLLRKYLREIERTLADRGQLTPDVEDELEQAGHDYLMRLAREADNDRPTALFNVGLGQFLERALSAAASGFGGGGGAVRLPCNRKILPTVSVPNDDSAPSYELEADPVAESDCPHPEVVRRLMSGETVAEVFPTKRQRNQFYRHQLPEIRRHLEKIYERHELPSATLGATE